MMKRADDDAGLERAPIKGLIELEKTRLQQVLERAYRSPFYRDCWKAAHVRPDSIGGLEDLVKLPFVTRKELFEATRTKRGRIGCVPVNTWFASSSPENSYEWFPFSAEDFLGIRSMLERMGRVVSLRDGDIVLAVVDTCPRISAVIPYLWTYPQSPASPRLEFIVGSLDWYDTLSMTWIDFIQRRRPTVLFISTQGALMLAEKMRENLRTILAETRIGIFYGEPLVDSKTKISKGYALESYEVYSPTEHMYLNAECCAHQGIHLWMDTCIPEVIPYGGQDAILLWEAPPGTKGQLVITNFAECLPLIRYKTEESIIVEGVDRCFCGCTHPRISRLGNAEDR